MELFEILMMSLPLLLVGIASVLFLKLGRGGGENENGASEAAAEQVAGAGGRRPTASEMRRARRMQREGRAAGRAAEVEGEDDGGGEEPDERQPAPGVRTRGKKKSANREAKREHKEYRDAARSAKEAKDEKRKEKQADRDAEREERERTKAEEEQKLLEEKQAKEQEEYDAWKDMFSTDAAGSVEDEIAEESQGLLQEFIDYIKVHKVVVLEELAANFGLRTEEAVNRVRGLEEMGYITGVIDDRGKFIYISEEEMEKVATFINKKGRITIPELSAQSNSLIQLVDETKGEEAASEGN